MLGRERNTWTSGSDLRAHRRAARRDAAGRRTCSILERGAAALERPWPCTCSSLTLGARIAAVSGRREVCVCARGGPSSYTIFQKAALAPTHVSLTHVLSEPDGTARSGVCLCRLCPLSSPSPHGTAVRTRGATADPTDPRDPTDVSAPSVPGAPREASAVVGSRGQPAAAPAASCLPMGHDA